MGGATIGIGLVPNYDSIGIWGAVLLTFFRIIQGIGVGGEWGGAVLMAGEWTDPKRRGFTTSFAQLGAPAGMVLANGALSVMSFATSEEAFLELGLARALPAQRGAGVRRPVHPHRRARDAGVRQAARAGPRREDAGRAGVKAHWRELVLTALLRSGQQTPFYIFTTYVLTYATQTLGMERSLVLGFVMVQAVISTCAIPYFGHLSDVIGRRRITAIGCILMLVFPFIYFGCWTRGTSGWSSLPLRSGCRARTCSTAPGGLHRRALPGHAALQRRQPGLPAGLAHRGRPGADHRALSVPDLPDLDGRGCYVA